MRVFRALLFTFALLFFLRGSPSNASVLLDDDFNNTNFVNSILTNAFVDALNSQVRLKNLPMPTVIALKEFQDQRVIATADGIFTYVFDESNGTMNPFLPLSIPDVKDAFGVAVRQDIDKVWVALPGEVRCYQYNDSEMAYNPLLSTTGLVDLLAIAAMPYEDKVFTLQRSGSNTGLISTLTATEEGELSSIPALSFDTGVTDPLSIAVVPDTYDLIMTAVDGLYYYTLDDSSGGYSLDPLRSVTGITGNIAVSAWESNFGYIGLVNNEGKVFKQTDTGDYKEVVLLGSGAITNPVAISTKLGSYNYAVLTENGEVLYFSEDAETGQIVENPLLKQTGINIIKRYSTPAYYYSKVLYTVDALDTVRITTYENNDLNSSITYQVSSDGGLSWVDIIPGIWSSVSEGKDFAIRGLLNSLDTLSTPRLDRIIFEATKLDLSNFRVTEIALNDPGQTLPADSFPIKVKAGAEFKFKVDTNGCAESVEAVISTGEARSLTPLKGISEETNTWEGRFIIPVDTHEGNVISITITAYKGTKQKTVIVDPFVIVQGKVFQSLELQLTK